MKVHGQKLTQIKYGFILYSQKTSFSQFELYVATLFDYGIADKGGFPRSDLSVILVHCQDLVQHLHQSMTFLHGCTIVPVHIYIYMELLIRKCCYFALCEPMVWQNLIGKDLFEGFVKGCGKKKKTYFVLGANLNLVMSLNFCFERELCICVRIIQEYWDLAVQLL